MKLKISFKDDMSKLRISNCQKQRSKMHFYCNNDKYEIYLTSIFLNTLLYSSFEAKMVKIFKLMSIWRKISVLVLTSYR